MSGALLKTPLRQVQDVKHLLMNEQARAQLSMVAAKHMNPERMMRVMANSVRVTPKLAECDPMSLLGGLMQCASLGLEPNTVLGHAYLIPFENKRKGITEVQLVVGYKGLIDLARRSGHITSISANIHYSDDDLWEYEEGTEATLRHRPGAQEGDKLHAYAIAKFKDGGHAYVVLPWKHVLKIRNASQGYQTAVRYGKKDSPWIAHEDAMAMKTAIRALTKYLPLSVEFSDAIQLDEKRADYAAFAMDPTQGVTIDIDADPIETGEDQNQTQDQQQIERGQEQRLDVGQQEQRQKEPAQRAAPAQERRKATPRQDSGPYAEGAHGAGKEAAQQQREPEPAKDQGSMFNESGAPKADPSRFAENSWGKTFLQDVTDLGFEEAYSLNDLAFDKIRDDRPDFFDWLKAEILNLDPAANL